MSSIVKQQCCGNNNKENLTVHSLMLTSANFANHLRSLKVRHFIRLKLWT